MRLTELHPTLEDAGDGAYYLEFACPAHGVDAKLYPDANPESRFAGFPDTVRIKIAQPLESQSPHVWGWNGERDFEKLTIQPSVNYQGHWHGHVTNGEVTTV